MSDVSTLQRLFDAAESLVADACELRDVIQSELNRQSQAERAFEEVLRADLALRALFRGEA